MFNKLIRRFPRGGRRMAIAYGGLGLALVAAGTMAYGAIGPAGASNAIELASRHCADGHRDPVGVGDRQRATGQHAQRRFRDGGHGVGS